METKLKCVFLCFALDKKTMMIEQFNILTMHNDSVSTTCSQFSAMQNMSSTHEIVYNANIRHSVFVRYGNNTKFHV